MTSEVIIANSQGIAMAADSAVTINGQKIYNSALKLFSLSKFAPVGVMIYGGAALAGVPWETIIKVFRHELGEKKLDNLEEYASEFIAHINSYPYWNKQSDQEHVAYIINTVFGALLSNLEEKIEFHFKDNKTLSDDQSLELFKVVISEFSETIIEEKRFLDGYSKKSILELKKSYAEVLKKSKEEFFSKFNLDNRTVGSLYNCAIHLLITETFNKSQISGIAIAGYGQMEIYPNIVTYEFDGIVEQKPRVRINEEKTRSLSSNQCTILAYAQEDMVMTFMCGLNPSIQAFLDENLAIILDRIPEIISDDFLAGNDDTKQAIREYITKEISGLNQKSREDLDLFIQNQQIRPIMSLTSSLPKDELAAMAESLINLTAFKRKMSDSLETVGGPIDVAVISKGDGLVWVRRKHYFPRELNSSYFGTYFHGYDRSES